VRWQVTLEAENERLANSGQPDPAGDASAQTIVNFAAPHVFVDTPGHGQIFTPMAVNATTCAGGSQGDRSFLVSQLAGRVLAGWLRLASISCLVRHEPFFHAELILQTPLSGCG